MDQDKFPAVNCFSSLSSTISVLIYFEESQILFDMLISLFGFTRIGHEREWADLHGILQVARLKFPERRML